MRPPIRGPRYWAPTLVGIAALVYANYYLRSQLEGSSQYLFNFYRYFYPDAVKVVFAPDFPKWRLLLPLQGMTGSWTPMTLVLAHYASDWIGPARAWYLFNAILIIVSFGVAWSVFRSRVFAFTLAICMGFGTQLYVTYPNSGTIAFPLLFCYFEVLLLCIYRVITAETRRTLWKIAFGAALTITALAYEAWLDFLVFVWLASAVLAVMLWRRGERVRLRRLAGVFGVMTAVGLAYVYIKVTYGYGQSLGMESDVIFNYPHAAPAIEDVISNLFMNLYMAVTNFLPPMFVSSTALYTLGADRLVELQYGYHAPFTFLVPMQYVFLWRYYAGAIAVLVAWALFRALKSAWRSPSLDRIAMLVFVIMVATGGPTHAFIKARPMNSMAVQTYHVLTAVLGMSLLIALVLMLAWRRWPRLWPGGALIVGSWAVIFYAALARPAMISHQAGQSGLGIQVYPNPMAILSAKLRIPYKYPAGLNPYMLEHSPPRQPPPPAPFGGGLMPLPLLLPDVRRWTPLDGVSFAAGDLPAVLGNDTSSGSQLLSPPLTVPRDHTLLVRVQGTIEQGPICVGALEEPQQRWLVPADQPRSELVIQTGTNARVRIVFANCHATAGTPTRFTIQSVSYGLLRNAGDGDR